jgi:hypothetical protein
VSAVSRKTAPKVVFHRQCFVVTHDHFTVSEAAHIETGLRTVANKEDKTRQDKTRGTCQQLSSVNSATFNTGRHWT